MLTPVDIVSTNVINEAARVLTAQVQRNWMKIVLARILERIYLKTSANALGSQIRRQQLIPSTETSGC